MKNVAIIGMGEIGSSLNEVYKTNGFFPQVKDLEGEISGELDILNICIPGELKDFVQIVNEYANNYNAKLVIIHSTVPIGTTKQIKNSVHSPVRGVHPNLKEGIEKFCKFIGFNDHRLGKMAASHYEELGIDYCLEENSDSTELAKLLSTTYYGLCIAWHGEMKKMCDKYNVRFDVIDEWTKTYNSGYKELGMPHVVRPALYPPKNGIGGHCIVSNVEILLNDNESLALDLIKNYKKRSYKLSDQAVGALMMALQKSLMEQSDIVPVLKGFNVQVDDTNELVVMNPPTVAAPSVEMNEVEA